MWVSYNTQFIRGEWKLPRSGTPHFQLCLINLISKDSKMVFCFSTCIYHSWNMDQYTCTYCYSWLQKVSLWKFLWKLVLKFFLWQLSVSTDQWNTVVSYWWKCMQVVIVNCMRSQSLPRNNVDWRTVSAWRIMCWLGHKASKQVIMK